MRPSAVNAALPSELTISELHVLASMLSENDSATLLLPHSSLEKDPMANSGSSSEELPVLRRISRLVPKLSAAQLKELEQLLELNTASAYVNNRDHLRVV